MQTTYLAQTHVRRFLEQCDGLIMSTAEPYELQAIASVKAWFAETSRSVYSVGPLLSPVDNPRSFEEEKKTSAKAKEIDQFMDTIYKSHGEKSLVYVCVLFGSYSLYCPESWKWYSWDRSRLDPYSGLPNLRRFGLFSMSSSRKRSPS